MLSPLISALIAGGIAAGVGAGVAGIATGITNIVNGVTPWDDPKKWFTSELKNMAIGAGGGFVTGGVGSLVGGALGGAGGMAGVVGGSSSTAPSVGGAVSGAVGGAEGGALPAVAEAVGGNAGTIAADAGAATPTSLGVVAPDKLSLLSAAKSGTPGTIREATKNLLINSTLQAGMGAAQNPRNPGRAALIGAAAGAASSAATGIGNIAFKGSGASFVRPSGGYTLAGGGDGFTRVGTSAAYNPSAGLSLAGSSNAQVPSIGGGFGSSGIGLQPEPFLKPWQSGLISQTGKFAGKAAGMGVTQATEPGMPPDPNPYATTPYSGGSNYWRRFM